MTIINDYEFYKPEQHQICISSKDSIKENITQLNFLDITSIENEIQQVMGDDIPQITEFNKTSMGFYNKNEPEDHYIKTEEIINEQF